MIEAEARLVDECFDDGVSYDHGELIIMIIIIMIIIRIIIMRVNDRGVL